MGKSLKKNSLNIAMKTEAPLHCFAIFLLNAELAITNTAGLLFNIWHYGFSYVSFVHRRFSRALSPAGPPGKWRGRRDPPSIQENGSAGTPDVPTAQNSPLWCLSLLCASLFHQHWDLLWSPCNTAASPLLSNVRGSCLPFPALFSSFFPP